MAKKASAKKGGGARKPAKQKAPLTIPENKLVALMRRCKSGQSQISELSGNLGEMVAKAAENDHLHKGAFAQIRKLDKMEPEKLRSWLYHFNHMLNASGLQKRADDAPELPMDEPEAEGEKSAEGEKPGEGGEQTEDDKKVVNLH